MLTLLRMGVGYVYCARQYLEHKFDLKKAIKLRRSRNAEYFRKWISDPSNYGDAEYVTKHYVDSIASATGILDTDLGKTLKMISFWTIGVGIGNIASGIKGSIMGLPLSAIFQNALDYGLDLLDTYILGNALHGKHPKLFISEVEDEVKFKQFDE